MTKLVEAIAKSLVDKPENVVVTETSSRQGTVSELKVEPDDMGNRQTGQNCEGASCRC